MKLEDFESIPFKFRPIWEIGTRALKNCVAQGIMNNFDRMEDLVRLFKCQKEYEAIWALPKEEWPDEFTEYHDYRDEIERRSNIQAERQKVRIETKKLIRAGILRTENCCKACGDTPTEIHHIPQLDGSYVADKIVWLCKGCHGATHAHLKSFYHPAHGLFLESKPESKPLDESNFALFRAVFGEEKGEVNGFAEIIREELSR